MITNRTSAAIDTMNTFETTNRKLEQFLFAHDIRHTAWYKGPDGYTVWVYPDTSDVKHVVAEYRAICMRRRERRNSVCAH